MRISGNQRNYDAENSGIFIYFMLHELLRVLKLHQGVPLDGVNQVLAFIQSHPRCRTNAIADGLNISTCTIERYLQPLKRDIIKFRGTRRNGGYYIKKEILMP